tara:strand:- start:157 stop:720 length:564 start_codon:yes stop_codon:yes gene_type:complete
MNFIKTIAKFLIIISILNLSSCGGLPKADWSKPAEPDGKKRARQNVKDGKGVLFDIGKKRGDTNFMFASSNPLWRASLDTIDFMSLASVDYAGGLIITDWYSEDNLNESVKVTITFLSNEIRADGLKIDIRKKNCNQNNQCIVKKINSELNDQIKTKILKKAALYQKDYDKKIKKNRPKKVFSGENE